MTAVVCGFMSGAVKVYTVIIDCLYLDCAPKLVSLEKFGEKISPQKDGNSAE